MASTYTLNNGIELIGTGEQSGTWGNTTNTNFELLDTALDGQVTITASSAGSSGSPNSLPITDGSASNGRNRLINITSGSDLGATVFYQLTPNDAEKIVYIRNSLNAQDLIVFQGTYNSSNDYLIPNGTTAVVFFNGAGSGAVAANVFNNAHFDALNVVGDLTVTGDTVTFSSANANDPNIIIKNTTNDTNGARLTFTKDKGAAGADGDDIGVISFISDNDAQQQTTFAKIIAEVSDASDGTEGGKLNFQIASHDGEMAPGLIINDGDAEDEVDVTIGFGIESLTTIAGKLTSTGSATIDLADGVADNVYALTVKNQEATDDRSFGLLIHAGSSNTDRGLVINDHDGSNALFYVTGVGRAGIKTTAPLHSLDIDASATGAIPTNASMGTSTENDNYFGFHNTNNSATFSGISLETRTSGASRWLIANEWQDTYLGDLAFRVRDGGTSSSETFRLSSFGNVKVGGSATLNDWFNAAGSFGAKFQVETKMDDNDENYIPAAFVSSAANTAPAYVAIAKNRGGAYNSVTSLNGGDSIGAITFQGADGTTYLEAARIECGSESGWGADDGVAVLEFYTNSGTTSVAKRMTIQHNSGNNVVIEDGLTLSDGNLIIGGAGHGIDFSAQTASSVAGATTTAEILDHYEEGNCTMTLQTSGGGSITLDSSSDKAFYTRVGRLVTVGGRLEVSSVSSPSGHLYITGFPFTASFATEQAGLSTASGIVFNPSSNLDGQLAIEITNTHTTSLIVREGGGQAAGVTTMADKIDADSLVAFSVTYVAA